MLPDHFLSVRLETHSADDAAILLERIAGRIRLGHQAGECAVREPEASSGGFVLSYSDPDEAEDRVLTAQVRRYLEQPAPMALCKENKLNPAQGLSVLDAIALDTQARADARLRANAVDARRPFLPPGTQPVLVEAYKGLHLFPALAQIIGDLDPKEHYALGVCSTRASDTDGQVIIALLPLLRPHEIQNVFMFLRDAFRTKRDTLHVILTHENALLAQAAWESGRSVRAVIPF